MAAKALTRFLLVVSFALGIHAWYTQSTDPIEFTAVASLAPSPSPTSVQQTPTMRLTSTHEAQTLAPTSTHQVVGVEPHAYQVMDTPQMYSDKWEAGKRLIGYVQLQLDVVSLAPCFSHCTRMLPNCESLNMSLNPKVNTSLYTCELNSQSVDEVPIALMDDPNYIYYDVFSNK